MKQKIAELESKLNDANKRILKLEKVALLLSEQLEETHINLAKIFDSLANTIKAMIITIGGLTNGEKN